MRSKLFGRWARESETIRLALPGFERLIDDGFQVSARAGRIYLTKPQKRSTIPLRDEPGSGEGESDPSVV